MTFPNNSYVRVTEPYAGTPEGATGKVLSSFPSNNIRQYKVEFPSTTPRKKDVRTLPERILTLVAHEVRR